MTSRILLLTSAAILIPATPSLAQQPAQAPAGQPQALPSAPTQQSSSPTAQEPPAAQPTDDLGGEEDIVITGQRARGSVVGDIPPENTLDARDVRATGATSITELLDALAPQIGSSRGRGGEAPVLLLNGQRISSFREIRDIPTEAIQRVEILPEEVALKYGYRADQKVVNIVLRQRFRSTTAQVAAGIATDGGYATGNADVTRFLVQRNGRTTLNLHASGNSMLTEAERNIRLDPTQTIGTTDQDLAARSLVGSNRDLRGSATFNRTVFGNVSGTLNTELEHSEGRSLIGLNPSLLEPLARTTAADSAHAGVALNGTTKSQWRWTVTGNADLDGNVTRSDRDNPVFPTERAHSTTASGDLKATANGKLFKLPGGDATTTLTLGGSTVHLDSTRSRLGVSSSNSLSRTMGEAAVNLDLPVSRRNRDFSALGNLTLNANAEVDQLSDFGTLTTIGAGANFSPLDRLNFIASWTREEGPPTIDQLGDPVLDTPGSRIFDFTTGQTVLIDAITGGNPNLQSDLRHVVKLSTNWQPLAKTDLRLRADFVHQTTDRPISNISVTEAIEEAFPGRFVRGTCTPQPNCIGPLLSVDLRPVNFDSARRDALRVGFDFSKPLKSRRPSQSVLDQMRAQFGFGGRGAPGAGQSGAPAAGGSAPAGPPPEGAGGASSGGSGGGGRGFGGRGGGGGGGGGFFGGGGGNGSRGRLQFSLTDTITFVDKVRITPGGPELDYLHGDAAGATGGTPRHNVQAQAGWSNNGLGARIGANWRSGTTVTTDTGDNLHFSPLGTLDLRLFANPGDIPEVAVKHPWLRGTQVRLEVNNLFNSRPNVRDATGTVPLNYQADLLDPLGRTIMISFRKLFLPSPATFRRLFQQDRQQTSPTR
ncbi:TonB-dependent receptor [Sphingomonas sp.]|uniref:TonB-dependent receptor n=1 Tax=Sphingomonas sp. TaxID=28214 RepID=UPI0038AF7593